MNFSVNRKDIADALAKIVPITTVRTNISVTECVLIECVDGGGKIRLSGTDLQTGIATECNAQTTQGGRFAVNAKQILEICRSCQDDIAFWMTGNRQLEIRSGKSVFSIVTMDTDDFPDVFCSKSVTDGKPCISVPSQELKQLIRKTGFVTGTADDRRAHIMGIELACYDNTLTFTSTDGARLSVIKTDIEPSEAEHFKVIVPKTCLKTVSKVFSGNDSTANIWLINSHVVFRNDTDTISVRILEGNFPDTQSILAEQTNCQNIVIDRKALYETLRRAQVIATDCYKYVTMLFKDSELDMTITNNDTGEFREVIPVEYTGAPVSLYMNVFFVSMAVAMNDAENVVVGFTNGDRPVFFTEQDNDNYRHLIMCARP